jgi:hypothetical protein
LALQLPPSPNQARFPFFPYQRNSASKLIILLLKRSEEISRRFANSRLLAMADGRVTFRWRDYAHGHQTRTMTLEADEFLRRFLLHVLPASFVRIRYFGLLANHRPQAALGISVNIAIVAPCG